MSSYHDLFQRIRLESPLIHCISNIVSANVCANLALAIGARPIMAQAPEETAEIADSAQAVVLNLGTPSAEKYLACTNAGKSANRKNIPVVIDPVGVGASKFRYEETAKLLACVAPSILRVNLSEAMVLRGIVKEAVGVDAVTEATLKSTNAEEIASTLALQYHCTVLLSGETDLVTDGTRLKAIRGGSVRMKQVTGTGCMLSVLCGCALAIEKDSFNAAVNASAFWKQCALAANKGQQIGSYATALLDEAASLSEKETIDFEG